jgi:hypothetical protein
MISREFSIDEELMKKKVQKHIGMRLQIVKEDQEIIKIIKLKPRKSPDDTQRCQARVAKHGAIEQCSFHKLSKCDFCKRHQNGHSKFGVVGDPEPELPSHNPLKKYNKIY